MNNWITPNNFAFLIIAIALIALIWRQIVALQGLTGTSTRARDRERQDNHQLVQQLMEKLYANNHFDMARLHSIERLRKNQIDAETEKVASGNATPTRPETEEQEYVNEDKYEN